MSQPIATILAGALIAAAIVLNTSAILLKSHRTQHAASVDAKPGFLRSLEHTGTVTRTNNSRSH
jgi:hypothetical protein